MRTQHLICTLLTAAIIALPPLGCSPNGQANGDSGASQPALETSEDEGGEEDVGSSSAGSETDADEQSPTPRLFIIERSKNANIVAYDARLTEEGELDAEEPVEAYWILDAEGGQREELSWLQKKMAYGFETKPASSGEGSVMKMVPLPKRELRVRKVDGKVRAELEIDGRPAVLEKIYVDSDARLTGPKVNYVELFGRDLETGEKRYEKIVPD